MSLRGSSKRTRALVAANCADSRKSAGPRTPLGQRHSSWNTVQHVTISVRLRWGQGPGHSRPSVPEDDAKPDPLWMHTMVSVHTTRPSRLPRVLEIERTKPECHRSQSSSKNMSVPGGPETVSVTADREETPIAVLGRTRASEQSRNVIEKKVLAKICRKFDGHPIEICATSVMSEVSGGSSARSERRLRLENNLTRSKRCERSRNVKESKALIKTCRKLWVGQAPSSGYRRIGANKPAVRAIPTQNVD